MERAVALAICRGSVLKEKDRPQQVANRLIPKPSGANDALRFMGCTPFPHLDVEHNDVKLTKTSAAADTNKIGTEGIKTSLLGITLVKICSKNRKNFFRG
jgi:hypothetical protein